MELGLFMMPCHPPERNPRDAAAFDLATIRRADELGYREAWIGEHFTSAWEPVPAPDLLIAQALRETKSIVLAPGAHVLPYHHPVELAHRIAYLDQLAAGRYMLGVATGALASDAELFGTLERTPDGKPNLAKNHEMTLEALEIMVRIWEADGPFTYDGKYWSVHFPAYDDHLKGPHLRPYQKPYPPIGMASLTPRSSTLRSAGERGFIPLSLNLSPTHLAGQWEAYCEGAAAGGHAPDRGQWRVGREFLVADTDEEALKLATGPQMGRAESEFLIPGFKKRGALKIMVPDPNVSEDEITADYLARHVWLVGSPDTVVERLVTQYRQAGGWGVLLGITFDFADNPEPWMRSLELMAKEVLPRVNEQIAKLDPSVAT